MTDWLTVLASIVDVAAFVLLDHDSSTETCRAPGEASTPKNLLH